MALNASGPISVGGTAAMASIEQEIGSPFTTPFTGTASINDALLRTLSGTTTGTQVSFNTFYGKSNAIYWASILWYAGSEDSNYITAVAADSSDNIYSVSEHYAQTVSNTADYQIVKQNAAGVIQWQRSLGCGSGTDYPAAIAVDTSGNVFVIGWVSFSSSTWDDAFIAKYNTSGVIQWQRRLGGTGSDYGYAIATDSNGDIYISGTTSSISGSSYDLIIAKYNTSGVIQWQRRLYGAGDDFSYSMAVDTSGNSYMCGFETSQTAGYYDILISKYNASGVIQWQRRLGGVNAENGYAIAVDTSGNVFITGNEASQGAGLYDIIIAKYNTSGVIQWQRRLGGTGSDTGEHIAVDSNGDIYISGIEQSQMDTLGYQCAFIAKYNTSGVIQWQRRLGNNLGGTMGLGLAVTSKHIYLGASLSQYMGWNTGYQGSMSSDYLRSIFNLRKDGTGTGNYTMTVNGYTVPIVYQAMTLTDAAMTLTDAALTLTDAAMSLTDAAMTITTNATLTTLNENATTSVNYQITI